MVASTVTLPYMAREKVESEKKIQVAARMNPQVVAALQELADGDDARSRIRLKKRPENMSNATAKKPNIEKDDFIFPPQISQPP